ncbi:hypothetical protein Ga0451573_003838, partial [Peptococcaceae bacterium DYL19]|nr:hypothetical protein [Phosphitispora fastidiosa]
RVFDTWINTEIFESLENRAFFVEKVSTFTCFILRNSE